MKIQTRLEQLLDEHECTGGALAAAAGLHRSTVLRILDGQRRPTASTLACIAPVFGLTIDELVGGTDAAHLAKKVKGFVRQSTVEIMLQEKDREFGAIAKTLVVAKSNVRAHVRAVEQLRAELVKLEEEIDGALVVLNRNRKV